ncbi:hypothetical protein B0H14DRAFT_2594813 [Mycena olivaceomarginata]|nr:hypothetical protein B0H14DRAFT_2594813 [Mycena olivaceomarginata]
MSDLAGQEWWKFCRSSHWQCQERNAAAPIDGDLPAPSLSTSPDRQMVGLIAIYQPTSRIPRLRRGAIRYSSFTSSVTSSTSAAPSQLGSGTSDSTSSVSAAGPSTSAPCFFVIPHNCINFFQCRQILTLIRRQSACAESRRSGAKEVRVVQSFEAAVETIASTFQLTGSSDSSDLGVADETQSPDRELKSHALEDIRHNAPHTQPVQKWLDDKPGREELKARVAASKLQREAEAVPGDISDAASGRLPEEIQKSHEDLKKRVGARKARRDNLDRLRNAPSRGPKMPHAISTPSTKELKRQAQEEEEKLEDTRVRTQRVAYLDGLRKKSSNRT